MSNNKDNLGDRMKGYENISRTHLTRRIPAIIRVDGKAFHTFTRGMKRPFDPMMTKTMQDTMKYLCENIQGCVLGYTQSDEITLVLTDYATIKTDAWFGYGVQKMCSIAASMATLAFNKAWRDNIETWCSKTFWEWEEGRDDVVAKRYVSQYDKALFDARVFSVPKDEVCNCLIWRQQDATRNSIEAVGQANFSQRKLHKKSCDQIQEMLFSEKGINWNNFPTELKRGSCCTKKLVESTILDPRNLGGLVKVERRKWIIDHEIPVFTQNRSYIESLI